MIIAGADGLASAVQEQIHPRAGQSRAESFLLRHRTGFARRDTCRAASAAPSWAASFRNHGRLAPESAAVAWPGGARGRQAAAWAARKNRGMCDVATWLTLLLYRAPHGLSQSSA